MMLAAAAIAAPVAAEPHCAAGGALPDLPPPALRPELPVVPFPITTSSREAQRQFDTGLTLLHSFWSFEAYRSFKEAARLDPQAPMPHWGMHMALGTNSNAAAAEAQRQSLARALALAANATEKERMYIEAVRKRAEAADRRSGRDVYLATMHTVAEKFPDDAHAALFLAIEQLDGYTESGEPYPRQREAEQLLETLLARDPSNLPAHHYWIHAVELSPDTGRARKSAELFIDRHGGVPHLAHMPGHVLFPLGEYHRASEVFLRARELDERYLAQERVSIHDNWNYLHNMDYLVLSLTEEGRIAEARAVATTLAAIAPPEEGTYFDERYRLVYEAWLAPAKVALRLSQFARAAEESESLGAKVGAVSPRAELYYKALAAQARARHAAAENDTLALAKTLPLVEELYARLAAAKPAAGEHDHLSTAATIVHTGLLELRALAADTPKLRDKWFEEARARERKLRYRDPPRYVRPVLQTIGETALRDGRAETAREAFEQLLKERPQSAFALCPLAHAAKAAAAVDADTHLARCRAALRHADPELQRLQEGR